MVLPLEAFAALLRSRMSDRDSASAWIAAKIQPSTLAPNPTTEPFLLDVARLMAVLDRPDESMTLIRNIIHSAQDGGRTRTLIQAKVALAGQLTNSGNNSEALSHIVDALQLAAPEGFVSTFVDEGGAIRKLLNEAKSRVSPELGFYVERVLTGFAPAENPPVQRETDHPSDLSVRESEILSLIAEGMSNQEIADRLVISITTVKTHTGNIYNKLGVTSRTRALARAEELGLLPRR
jgi:LuxR family maltose regulon positive regulatory protein